MKSTCSENNTCCQMDDQDYACCLFPKVDMLYSETYNDTVAKVNVCLSHVYDVVV
jgi:hypothetical protein